MKKEKLLELLNQMTLEEKIGQLVQIKGEIFLMDDNRAIKRFRIIRRDAISSRVYLKCCRE